MLGGGGEPWETQAKGQILCDLHHVARLASNGQNQSQSPIPKALSPGTSKVHSREAIKLFGFLKPKYQRTGCRSHRIYEVRKSLPAKYGAIFTLRTIQVSCTSPCPLPHSVCTSGKVWKCRLRMGCCTEERGAWQSVGRCGRRRGGPGKGGEKGGDLEPLPRLRCCSGIGWWVHTGTGRGNSRA